MVFKHLTEVRDSLQKANLDLQPELLSADQVTQAFAQYAQLEKMAAYGKTALASRINEAAEVARAGGTSVGKAKATLDTARLLADADQVREAFKSGDISFDQASEIATAEQARPGSSSELLQVASNQSFQVLKDKARKIVLEAEQSRGLAERQHQARSARSHQDRLGMINLHLVLEPHIGSPIVNRAQAEGARLYRTAKREGDCEPFERYLADAYAGLLGGTTGSARARRPELVVVVSHEVAARGWNDVRDGDGATATGAELCKIPGVGPVSPEVAKQIAQDAFLTGLFYDGSDLRHIRRWSRSTPIEVLIALELGDPPSSTGSSASTAANVFGPRTITSSPTAPAAPRR